MRVAPGSAHTGSELHEIVVAEQSARGHRVAQLDQGLVAELAHGAAATAARSTPEGTP